MHHLVTVIVVGRFVMQFLVANGVSPSTMQILDTIRDRVYSQTNPLALADLYNRPLYLQCDLSRYIYNWTGRLPPLQRSIEARMYTRKRSYGWDSLVGLYSLI